MGYEQEAAGCGIFSGRSAPSGYLSQEGVCVSIIGMAAAGKTTLGREMAKLLDWPFVDTDHLIESAYGVRLQTIADALSKDDFLDMEAAMIKSLRLRRCVVSTGGSVVYRPEAVASLASMGPLLYINVPLSTILERIARKPDRGLAIAAGQTIDDLYNERRLLYEAAATITINGGEEPAQAYARHAVDLLLGRRSPLEG